MAGVIRSNRAADMPTSSGTARGNPSFTVIKISYLINVYQLSTNYIH
jgi:hypothetical protein